MRMLLLFVLCFNSYLIIGQEDKTKEENQSFIEVTGTASKEIVPDRIFIEIILTEKTIDRKKYTIQEQEAKLKSIIQSLNIGIEKLALSNSTSKVLLKRNREKGIKLTKEYILEVSTSQKVNSTFQALHNANIKEASIIKTENSKITEIRKEVRIEAIKAAKEKAEYLLNAIDEELGQPIEIKETIPYDSRRAFSNTSINSNITQFIHGDFNFEVIEVKFSYYVKYAIKEKE